MTIEELYQELCRTPSDISTHLPALRRLADECQTVVEFGVRTGNSTVAFLASAAGRVVSFDIEAPQTPLTGGGKWEFHLADTAHLSCDDMPECDLLFIDTAHRAKQVWAELGHADKVERFIVLHDTHLFGCCEEGRPGERLEGVGILTPVLVFLANNPEWRVRSHTAECCGLTVLEKWAR